MHISRLALDHYRSWERCVLDFEPGVNILQGANGLGKTNIVEAVEVLSTGSSHRTSSSLPLIERGCASATIRANVEDDRNRHSYEVTIAARGANRARIDGACGQRQLLSGEGHANRGIAFGDQGDALDGTDQGLLVDNRVNRVFVGI